MNNLALTPLKNRRARTKIYMLLALLAVTCFFWSMAQIGYVVVDRDDFMGLTSHLPPTYWVGLVLILLACLAAFMDREAQSDVLFLFLLSVLALLLTGPGVFSEENPRFSMSYYPAGETQRIITEGRVDILMSGSMMTYHCWPAFHFVSASLLLITGSELGFFQTCAPLFWAGVTLIVTYAIGRKLLSSANYAFILSALVLAGFWYCIHAVWDPQMLGYLLLPVLFLLVMSISRHQVSNRAATVICYGALVITHGLTSIAGFLGAAAYYLSRKSIAVIILLLMISVAWWAYLAPRIFEAGLDTLYRQLKELDFFSFTSTPAYTGLALPAFDRYLRLAYPIVIITAGALTVIALVVGRIRRENRRAVIDCLLWLAGLSLLFFYSYGQESDMRMYAYALMPLAAVIVLGLRNRLVLAALLTAFVLLHVPANYGLDFENQTRNSELSGARFFAQRVDDQSASVCTSWGTIYYVSYYDPEKIDTALFPTSLMDASDVSPLGWVDYVVESERERDSYIMTFGFDPVGDWIRQGNGGLIYSNGSYLIVENR
jgi:hypothetical protein